MLLFFAFFSAALAFAPPVLPVAFNTTFIMTLPGALVDPTQQAFWSYDSLQGGQYVWHPSCPFGGSTGCSIFFAGGYSNPVIYSVSSVSMTSQPLSCCLFFAGVPILPRVTFSKYQFVINTTILHAQYGSLNAGLFFSQNRQCLTVNGVDLNRIIDVDTVWDLPSIATWSVGAQPSNWFQAPSICQRAKVCGTKK